MTDAIQTLSLRDLKLVDLREDAAKAQAKLDTINGKIKALENEANNEAAIEALTKGSPVAYVYGRAATKRILFGVVFAVGKNDKGVVQLRIEFGTGLDAEFHLIDASSLLMTSEQVEAAQKDIDEAGAEAASKAPTPEAQA